jgi:hypothetical protein
MLLAYEDDFTASGNCPSILNANEELSRRSSTEFQKGLRAAST